MQTKNGKNNRAQKRISKHGQIMEKRKIKQLNKKELIREREWSALN